MEEDKLSKWFGKTREVPMEFRSEIVGKPFPFGSGDGLSLDSGTDYDFHKEVVEEKLVRLHDLATDKLNLVASHILHTNTMILGEPYDRGINYYANRVQYHFYRSAGHILMALGNIEGKDIEALEKMGIVYDNGGGKFFTKSDDMCTKCGIPLLVGIDVGTTCGKCEFFSTLKVPKKGVID